MAGLRAAALPLHGGLPPGPACAGRGVFGHGSKTGTGTWPEPVFWVVVESWLGGESPFLNHARFCVWRPVRANPANGLLGRIQPATLEAVGGPFVQECGGEEAKRT